MSQSEDAAMQGQQLPAAHPSFYLPPSQAQGEQLPPGDDAVLFLGKLPHHGRRFEGRCNAFYIGCTDNALHRGLEVVVLAGRNAFSGRWMDRALHPEVGVASHRETLARTNARVARSV
jgi:hypothetical protein